jgi:hypothetical protein
MPMRNLTVTFHTNIYSKKSARSKKGFQFPKELFKLFRFRRHGSVALVITRTSGEAVFHGLGNFTSGTEITKAAIFRDLDFDEEIRVTASCPPASKPDSR